MEVEKIIISKQFVDLSPEELVEISNYASNASEFEDMKAFLISTQAMVSNQKIEATPDLDKKVLNYLHHSYPQAQPWYNSVLLFLFPRDKSFFKYPAFQIVIATMLVFGAFNLIDIKSIDNDNLAYEDFSKVKQPKIENIKEKEVDFKEFENTNIIEEGGIEEVSHSNNLNLIVESPDESSAESVQGSLSEKSKTSIGEITNKPVMVEVLEDNELEMEEEVFLDDNHTLSDVEGLDVEADLDMKRIEKKENSSFLNREKVNSPQPTSAMEVNLQKDKNSISNQIPFSLSSELVGLFQEVK